MEIQWDRLEDSIANRQIQYPLYAASVLAANSFARSKFRSSVPSVQQ
jgi:hypothetical protein